MSKNKFLASLIAQQVFQKGIEKADLTQEYKKLIEKYNSNQVKSHIYAERYGDSSPSNNNYESKVQMRKKKTDLKTSGSHRN